MTYWDWIRCVNIAVLLALMGTSAWRLYTGRKMFDPRDLLQDPAHLHLMRMGQTLLYAALIESNVENLIRDLPGGPRVIAPLPGLVLILFSMHWRPVYRKWRRTVEEGRYEPRVKD